MTRMCRACPNPHQLFLQAEPDWYRPSVGEQIKEAVGCFAQMLGILIAAVAIWLIGVGVFIALSGGPK